MAALVEQYGDIAVPTITEDDLKAFHFKHFPGVALPLQFFLAASGTEAEIEDDCYYDEDEDGLGYYADGEKRTLTDTQISIFRHSEVQRILWREAGEYSGPIFQKTAKEGRKRPKTQPSLKKAQEWDRNANDKAQAKAKAKLDEAESSELDLADILNDGEEKESAAKPTPSSAASGTNRTAPTASERNRKKNRKQNAKRNADRKARDKVRGEGYGDQNQQESRKRGSTRSPEPRRQPAQKQRKGTPNLSTRAGRSKAGLEERHDPEDFKAEGGYTFRRMARDEDDVKEVAVDLDY